MKHVAATGSAYAERLLADWASLQSRLVKVMPREYKRALAEQAKRDERGRGRARRSDAVAWRGDAAVASAGLPGVRRMGKPTGFIEIQRKKHPTRPVAERVQDWREVYLPYPTADLEAQGARCMDCGIPFCHQGCPLGQPDPGLERPGLPRPLAARRSIGCTRPTTSRSSPASCVRRRARARACSASTRIPVTIKSIEATIIDRAWDEGWVTPQPPDAPHLEEGGDRRLRPGRAGRRRPAEPRRPLGDGLREVGPHRRAAALRHPRVQDGEALPRSPAGADGSRGRGVPAGVNVGVDVPADRLRGDFDAVLLAGGAEPAARPAGARPRARRASTSRWTT